LLSTLGTDVAIHDSAWLRNTYDPLPFKQECGLTADEIIQGRAPEAGPKLVRDKSNVPYFVVTRLKSAPFVAKTALKFPGQSGPQRSASHVVAGSWFAFDLDGLTGDQWSQILAGLDASGAKFCAYSSYSHGAEGKPGVRCRVLMFVDRTLAPMEWKRTWGVVNKELFEGRVDKQTGHLAQQAGVWATHPDRADRAFRVERDGALLSAKALLALAPAAPPRATAPSGRYKNSALSCGLAASARVVAALAWLNPSDYETWLNVALALKAGTLLGNLSDTAGRDLWLAFSARAGEDAKARNDDSRYDPTVLWDQLEPSAAPREALYAGLLGRARDAAVRVVNDAIRQNRTTEQAMQAAEYLGRYHPALSQELFQENAA
jgi:hypothetical protein